MNFMIKVNDVCRVIKVKCIVQIATLVKKVSSQDISLAKLGPKDLADGLWKAKFSWMNDYIVEIAINCKHGE